MGVLCERLPLWATDPPIEAVVFAWGASEDHQACACAHACVFRRTAPPAHTACVSPWQLTSASLWEPARHAHGVRPASAERRLMLGTVVGEGPRHAVTPWA